MDGKICILLVAAGLVSGALHAADDPLDETYVFIEKLENCEEYSGPFVHMLTGTTMNRHIEGMVDGNCIYKEEMPGDGMMTCEMSDASRTRFVKFYTAVADAQANQQSMSSQTSVKTTADGESESTSSFQIDGAEMDNPLEDAMASGTCKVSGY